MKRVIVLMLAAMVVVIAGFWLFMPRQQDQRLTAIIPTTFQLPTQAPPAETVFLEGKSVPIIEALSSAKILVPDVNVSVELKDGKWDHSDDTFSGIVTISPPFLVVPQRDEHDIFAVVSINYGGSGVFEYMGLFQSDGGSYSATNLGSLGDRVKVEMISLASLVSEESYTIEVSYLDRTESESMAQDPTKKEKATFTVENGVLITPTPSSN